MQLENSESFWRIAGNCSLRTRASAFQLRKLELLECQVCLLWPVQVFWCLHVRTRLIFVVCSDTCGGKYLEGTCRPKKTRKFVEGESNQLSSSATLLVGAQGLQSRNVRFQGETSDTLVFALKLCFDKLTLFRGDVKLYKQKNANFEQVWRLWNFFERFWKFWIFWLILSNSLNLNAPRPAPKKTFFSLPTFLFSGLLCPKAGFFWHFGFASNNLPKRRNLLSPGCLKTVSSEFFNRSSVLAVGRSSKSVKNANISHNSWPKKSWVSDPTHKTYHPAARAVVRLPGGRDKNEKTVGPKMKTQQKRRDGALASCGPSRRARIRAMHPLHAHDRQRCFAWSHQGGAHLPRSQSLNVSLSLPTTPSTSFVVAPLQNPLQQSRQRTWWATMFSASRRAKVVCWQRTCASRAFLFKGCSKKAALGTDRYQLKEDQNGKKCEIFRRHTTITGVWVGVQKKHVLLLRKNFFSLREKTKTKNKIIFFHNQTFVCGLLSRVVCNVGSPSTPKLKNCILKLLHNAIYHKLQYPVQQ